MLNANADPVMICIALTLTGGFHGLSEVSRAPDSDLGVLADCKSDDQEVHNSPTTHSLNHKTVTISCGSLSMHARGCTNTVVPFLWEVVET